MLFYDYFYRLIANPVVSASNMVALQGLALGLIWLMLVAGLVVQTGRKIVYGLIVPVAMMIGWVMVKTPAILDHLVTITGGGLLVVGAIILWGARRKPLPTPLILGFAGVLIGFSVLTVPLVTLSYGLAANRAHHLDRLRQIAMLDEAHFFLLCQRWQLSCGQQAVPDAGVPESTIAPDGRATLYYPIADQKMRVVIDRQSGRLMQDGFRLATEAQRLAVTMVWFVLALVAMALHHIGLARRGLPASAKPAT